MAYLPPLVDGLPEPVKDWEVIELTEQEARTFATVGVSLDEKTYMLPAGHNRVIDELDRRGGRAGSRARGSDRFLGREHSMRDSSRGTGLA